MISGSDGWVAKDPQKQNVERAESDSAKRTSRVAVNTIARGRVVYYRAEHARRPNSFNLARAEIAARQCSRPLFYSVMKSAGFGTFQPIEGTRYPHCYFHHFVPLLKGWAEKG
jgi:hypothetical protein